MRVGVISDVHANLVALEAVLDDMPAVDTLVCVGDVVGYNPWPAACVELVRENADTTVIGNHDRTLSTPERYRSHRQAHAGLELAAERVSAEQFEWVISRPRTTTVADGRFELVHSHPDEMRRGTYVYPDDFSELGEYVEDIDVLALGHTHVQGSQTVEGTLVLNPGSVGQPRDDDPRAAYAVVDLGSNTPTADLQRVEYDVERVQDACAEAGLPEETGERLADGE
ncbi:metallophosphoesterase family protein [Haloarchaeobius sp. DFWS5]|uniref:metallophosphoesterase family protein n=1 Tax=Haloarchaeobius sp. DFWS5 TaxID=3446114 RepID=UPI003EBE192F